MELAQLRSTLKAEPFKPFTVCLVDGRRYFVPHAEFMYVPVGMRHTTVFYSNEEEQAMTILDAIMISSIEFGDTRRPGTANGANGAPH